MTIGGGKITDCKEAWIPVKKLCERRILSIQNASEAGPHVAGQLMQNGMMGVICQSHRYMDYSGAGMGEPGNIIPGQGDELVQQKISHRKKVVSRKIPSAGQLHVKSELRNHYFSRPSYRPLLRFNAGRVEPHFLSP